MPPELRARWGRPPPLGAVAVRVLPVGYLPRESVTRSDWVDSHRVMASRDNSNRVRLQVWVSVDLADRLVVAAQEQDRSVSREAARRLEASFGQRAPRAVVADRLAPSEKPRVPPVVPPGTVEPVAEVVERLQQQVPGVQTASRAFPSVPQDLARQVTPRPRGGGR